MEEKKPAPRCQRCGVPSEEPTCETCKKRVEDPGACSSCGAALYQGTCYNVECEETDVR